jgi:hypothetical protein
VYIQGKRILKLGTTAKTTKLVRCSHLWETFCNSIDVIAEHDFVSISWNILKGSFWGLLTQNAVFQILLYWTIAQQGIVFFIKILLKGNVFFSKKKLFICNSRRLQISSVILFIYVYLIVFIYCNCPMLSIVTSIFEDLYYELKRVKISYTLDKWFLNCIRINIYASVGKSKDQQPKFKKLLSIIHLTTCCLEGSRCKCTAILYQNTLKLLSFDLQKLIFHVYLSWYTT